MKRIVLLICILLTTLSATAQFGRQRQNRLGRQQPNTPPNENQIANLEKKAEERQQEYIKSFITTLEADEFQKEIAKITIDDYYKEIKKFLKVKFENTLQQKDAFDNLKREHFKELKSLLSEPNNKKLDEFLDGKYKENDDKKEKKKKRKKKRKKDN